MYLVGAPLHHLLNQCGLAWSRSASGPAEVLWTSSSLDSVPLNPSRLRPWFPNEMSDRPVLLPSVRRFWHFSLVQEWLDTRNATVIVAHLLDTSVLMPCLLPQPTPCEAPTHFELPLLDNPLSLLLVQLLLPHLLLPLNMLWTFLDTALCEEPSKAQETFAGILR